MRESSPVSCPFSAPVRERGVRPGVVALLGSRSGVPARVGCPAGQRWPGERARVSPRVARAAGDGSHPGSPHSRSQEAGPRRGCRGCNACVWAPSRGANSAGRAPPVCPRCCTMAGAVLPLVPAGGRALPPFTETGVTA